MVLEKIDQYGKPGWIALTVLAFWIAWPLGLVTLAFLAGSGRLANFRAMRHDRRRWQNMAPRGPWSAASSGNNAFDDYRAETLRRLEDEEREFQAFLERLRQARDKSEFDAFMAERRPRPETYQPPA